MRKLGVVTMVLAAAACAAFWGCGGEEKGEQKSSQAPAKAPGTPGTATSTAGKAQTLCPVEGGKIDRSLFADYQGKRVYFCCAMCPPKFKADPEKYMAAMAKEGVVLEKSPESPK